MNRKMSFIAAVIAITIFAASPDLMAVKKVPKSGADSATAKNYAPDAKTKSSKTPEGPQQPPGPPREPVNIEKDNFIDADGDGINDNIQKAKPPEIKRDQAEPRRSEPQPKKEVPPEKEKPKGEERQTKKTKG